MFPPGCVLTNRYVIVTNALAIKGFISWYDDMKLKEELNKRNFEIELELIKSQINPHYLFNTINNIDVLIQKDPLTASQYLNKLSDIMRFILYETQSGKIALATELACIEKYIELQRIRSSNENYVLYRVEGDAGGLCVEPMLFIPFIENAFKHTGNKNAGNAIKITFVIQNNALRLFCENKYSKQQKLNGDKGLGDELIKRRLHLLYGTKDNLAVTDENETYTVKLVINDVH